jgi:hypothetical protein
VRAAADGTLYVSGDAAGLVLALTPSAAANHPF